MRAQQDQEGRRHPDVGDEVQPDHQHAHRDAQRDHAGGAGPAACVIEATTAPTAVPMATTPASEEACVVV